MKIPLYWIGGALLSLTAFMSIPQTATTDWLGITDWQQRIGALHNAAFWTFRAAIMPSDGERLEDPEFGQIEGLTENGELVLKVSKGDRWVRVSHPLAGIDIDDLYRSALHVQSLAGTTAKIDVYEEPGEKQEYSVVVWVRQKPVNLMLVEDGLARPKADPKTTIMDSAYASYYWRIAAGDNGVEG